MLHCDVLVIENSRLLIICINQTLLLLYLSLVDYWYSVQTAIPKHAWAVTPCEKKIFLSEHVVLSSVAGWCM